MRNKQTEQEIEQKRKLIQDTALNLLMEEEFHSITIRKLTASCGIATGTFFNYFSSKETLFLNLLYDKNIEYYRNELKRFRETAPKSFDDYIRFLLDGAKDMIENHRDLTTLFILHHAILSSVLPENVPIAKNKRFVFSMTDLAAEIHGKFPQISEQEALRHYSFLHVQLIGARHLEPITALGTLYPSWFDANEEILRAYKRYLDGVKKELN